MLRWLVGGGLAIILGAFGIFLATPQPVQACSCVMLTPPEQLEMASTVFHGRVTAMEPFTPAANSPKPWLDTAVQFQVDTVWKGTVAENIVIAVVSANEACGFELMSARNISCMRTVLPSMAPAGVRVRRSSTGMSPTWVKAWLHYRESTSKHSPTIKDTLMRLLLPPPSRSHHRLLKHQPTL